MFQPATTQPCKKCPLYKDSCAYGTNGEKVYSVCISGEGDDHAQIVLVGMGPGRDEVVLQRPFVGPSGQLLDDVLKHTGIRREEIFITNTIRCRAHINGSDRPPEPEEVKACADYLEDELAKIKPKVIGVLGNDAIKRILGKTSGVTKIRGIPVWSDKYNAYIVPTYHPSYIIRNGNSPKLRTDMMDDIRKMKQIAETPKTEHTKVSFYHTPTEVKKLVDILIQQEWITFDVETNGEEFWSDDFKLKCLSLTPRIGESHIVTDMENPTIRTELNRLFSSEVKTCAHNGDADIKWLYVYGIYVRNFRFDTMLAHHLLDENTEHKLKTLAWEFTEMGGYEQGLKTVTSDLAHKFRTQIAALTEGKKTPYSLELQNEISNLEDKIERLLGDKGRRAFSVSDFPQEIMWKYCGMDTDCTYRLMEVFTPRLKDENLWRLFNQVVIPLVEILIDMELYGVKIDAQKLEEFTKKYAAILKDIEARLREFPEVKEAERISNQGKKNPQPFNFKSPAQLQVLLFKVLKLPATKATKTGSSTDEEVLKSIAKLHEIPSLLLQHRETTKTISTYLNGIAERLDKKGRLHTSYLIIGTVTGRLSSRNPNLQNIPKDGDVKELFIVSPGCYLVEADYKQMDFRMWANYSNDAQMYIDLTSGKDIHRVIASQLNGIPEDKVTDAQRSIAKTVVYAVTYGINPYNLARQIDSTPEQAETVTAKFFKQYPDAFSWIQKTWVEVREQKQVVSTFGRKRRLPNIDSDDFKIRAETQRQAVNSKIQGMTADVHYIGMIRIWKKLKDEQMKTRFLMDVHDSVVFEVPEDEKDKFLTILRAEMLREVEGIHVPLGIDIKIGRNWGCVEKISETIRV